MELDYWSIHPGFAGIWLAIACILWPRELMFFWALVLGYMHITFFGFMGYFLCPSFTLGFVALGTYGDSNPFMCVALILLGFAADVLRWVYFVYKIAKLFLG